MLCSTFAVHSESNATQQNNNAVLQRMTPTPSKWMGSIAVNSNVYMWVEHFSCLYQKSVYFLPSFILIGCFLLLVITHVVTCNAHKTNSKTIRNEGETDRERRNRKRVDRLWLVWNIFKIFGALGQTWRNPATPSELQRKTRQVIYTSGQKSTFTVLWAYSKKLLRRRAGDGPLERDLPKQTDGPQNTAPQIRYYRQVWANR